jgi:hypothetical protein
MSAAHADDVANDVDGSVDVIAESLSLSAGAPATSVQLRIQPRNGDGDNGCNIEGTAETLVVAVASSDTAVTTVVSAAPFDPAHPDWIRFSACGDTPSISVTPLAAGTATVNLSEVSNNTGGTFDLRPATFTVTVTSACASVPTVAPTISETNSPAATGWYNAFSPAAAFTVTPAGNAQYSLDGGSSWLAYAGPVSLTDNGTFSVIARNVRPAGGGCTFAPGPESAATTFRIDRALPTLSLAVTPPTANGSGWNNVPVSIDWTCADTGTSGVASASCPSDISYGDTESAPAADFTVSDIAGNTSAPVERRAVLVDTTPPTLVAVVAPDANPAGWNNTLVSVTWTCEDATSGFSSPNPCPSPESFGEAASPVAARSETVTDLAGNATTASRRSILIDETEPSITVAVSPDATAGWNNGPVDADWECSGGASGLSPATPCPADETFTAEGDYPARTVGVDDVAGNPSAPATRREVRIDTTAPNVAVSLRDAGGAVIAPNGNGWFSDAVTVHFECSDPVSAGVASGVAPSGAFACPADIVIATDGIHAGTDYEVHDVAGNGATGVTPDVRIDTTAPVLSVDVTPDANAVGWNNSTVSVDWSCDESGSGLAVPCPTDVSYGNGTNEPPLSGLTVVDLAGNVSNAVDRRAIKVDTVAPVLGVAVAPALPNTAGWNNVPVSVSWTCSDTGGSGVDAGTCPLDETYGNGANLPAATFTLSDVAGNASTPVERRVIKVDTVSPTLNASVVPAANANGWNNSVVTAAWTCSDGTGSGFVHPSPCPIDESFDESDSPVAERTVTVTDLAGNSATATRRSIRIDVTSPSIAVAVSPDATSGWNNEAVDADWTCADGGSGLSAATPCPADESFTAEGVYPARTESVDDDAGNTSPSATRRDVRIDTTAPTVTVGLRDADGGVIAPNGAGWFSEPVTVHVDCSDPVSGGVASGVVATGAYACPADWTLTQGDHPPHGLEVRDVAGNAQIGATVPAIRIDTTAPQAAVVGATNGGSYLVGAAPTPTCTTTDAGGSGVAVPAGLTITGTADASGAGSFIATCSGGLDRAGNAAPSTSVSYTVGYGFLGFFQPINDPAGATPSVFRQGSTVPVKFALTDSRGARLSDTAAQAIADACAARLYTGTASLGSPGAVNEATSTSAASAGNCFRYDPAADQFIFNLNTKGLAPAGYVVEARVSVGSSAVTVHNVVVGVR